MTDKLTHGTYRFVLTSSRGIWYSTDWVYPDDFVPRSKSVSGYPNPLSNSVQFTVEGVEEGSLIEVFTQTGMLVLQTIATGNIVKITLNVPSGLYVVRTVNGEIKLVIEN
jgi:anaerobic selenocysteine-containing dehydrogenase